MVQKVQQNSAPKKGKKSKIRIKSWYSNRYHLVLIQRNLLLLFTILSMFSVSIAVLFVKGVMSSKSLEPYVIEVEKRTGIATVVDQLGAQDFTGQQVIKEYFINQFVILANSYDVRSYKEDSEKLEVFATRKVMADYKSRINPRELGSEGKIEVFVRSIQFIAKDKARVRVVEKIKLPNKTVSQNIDKVAELTFAFFPNDPGLTLQKRRINPLGFKVSSYIVAEEAF